MHKSIRIYLASLIILCYQCAIQAQTTFNTTIDFYFGTESATAVLPLNDRIIITGTGYAIDPPGLFDEKLKFLATDFDGNVLWRNVLADSAINYFADYRSIIQTIDGNVVFTVTRQTDTTSYPMLVKIDPATGDTIFTKYYDFEPILRASDIKELSDGSLILLGYDESDLYGSMIIKTTPEGDFLWEKRYGTSTERNAVHFDIFADTIYLVNSYNDCLPDRYWIRKLDADGNILDAQYYSDIGVCPVGARRTKEGGFYGSGVYYPMPPYRSFIYRTDTEGNFLWDYNTDFGDTIDSWQFEPFIPIETPYGDIVVGGYYEPNEFSGYVGLICKVDANGNPYWERSYRANANTWHDNMMSDVTILEDNSIVCVGTAYGGVIYGDYNFWLLKLDSMGCLIPGCDTLGLEVMDLVQEEAGMLVFPNPISEEAIVQINGGTSFISSGISYQLVSLSGIIWQNVEVPKATIRIEADQLRFPLHLEPHIPNGICLLRVLLPDRAPLEMQLMVMRE